MADVVFNVSDSIQKLCRNKYPNTILSRLALVHKICPPYFLKISPKTQID